MTVYMKGYGVNYKINKFRTCNGTDTIKIKIFQNNKFKPAMTMNAFRTIDAAIANLEAKGYEIYSIK